MDKPDPVDAVLTHYGVPGMKWGKRKAGTGPASLHKKGEAHVDKATGVSVDKKTGAARVHTVRTKEGDHFVDAKGRRIHEDAVNAAITKGRAKRSISTVSSADLKKANERINLEQNYSRMTQEKTKLDKGHAAVKTALALVATGTAVYTAINSPAFKAGRAFLNTQMEGAIDAAIPAGKGSHRLVTEAVKAAKKVPKHRA